MPSQLRRIPQYFQPKTPNAEGWSEVDPRDRRWEDAYRRRWQFDKIVRSTHGVNCTGSCSWKIYVKDGIITWETQQTDYPTNGPGIPEYEPRGCPRGASYSWYIYSPLRVRYPYVRGVLWELWRAALVASNQDPVRAWRSIVDDPERLKRYQSARGMGGFVRVRFEDVARLIAASLIHTIQRYGPDRVTGFTPIPAMSMVSFASGSRFLALLGGTLVSFYDWYADLPPASPQVWGEQTDVPESADWYHTGYMLVWGSNIPITRTPDAHFMVEVRYRGAGVAVISPDFTDSVKFADHWLHVRPGTDGALAMAMTHVVLQEFFVDRQVDYFVEYARKFTDLPLLVTLRPEGPDFAGDRYLRASDLGLESANGAWKFVVWDEATKAYVVPPGGVGHRWENNGGWHLELSDGEKSLRPALTLLTDADTTVSVILPVFTPEGTETVRRCVPVRRVRVGQEETLVTTVFDLLMAQVGVARGLSGDYPTTFDDPRPYTPAWQEAITGVDRRLCRRVAHEFAETAEITRGRSMIVMGSGINQWLHTDLTYRAILNLVLLTGAQGVNGGGWAHYVGQEKVRPLEGFHAVADATDWGVQARQVNGTSFFYFATDQWRYEQTEAPSLLAPWGARWKDRTFADFNVLAARLGWLPSYPQFSKNAVAVVEEARAAGARSDEELRQHVVDELKAKRLKFAIEDPDDPANFPRVLFLWRANLLGASGKGHEYFLRHLLGTGHGVLGADEPAVRPRDVVWRDRAPEGKLDLLVTLDFRMSGSALYSDVVLPAASWYEKHDLSSTDLHPFVHPLSPAIDPVWESKSDWETFRRLAGTFSELARTYFPNPVTDLVALPLRHDSPDEMAQPLGRVLEWTEGESEPVPGRTLPRLEVVERNYGALAEQYEHLGPTLREKGLTNKGIHCTVEEEYDRLTTEVGAPNTGVAAGCPKMAADANVCEAILTLSGATHGRIAVRSWEDLERRTGRRLKDLAEGRREERFTLPAITAQPRRVISAPVWSGLEQGGRQYTAFALNVERSVPWRTLTGRQQFFIDHELFRAFGEALPSYRPPFDVALFEKREEKAGRSHEKSVLVRWLTPHSKWSFHTTFSDNLRTLTLFRGGPAVWMNLDDARSVGVRDNDWIECYNRNGVAVARAMVTHRVPPGTAIMYHAQDRLVNVPGSPLTGRRGGLHNSVTRIQMKPTQMVGGYGQLSFAPNYYGPTGTQRDTRVYIRRLPEVNWLES